MWVFVSSASVDSRHVDELRRALAADKASPWRVLAPIDVDPAWRELARQAIASCDAFLFVTSRHSVASRHCAWELDTALELGKPRVQWVIETVPGEHAASSLPLVKVGRADDAPAWDFGQARPRR